MRKILVKAPQIQLGPNGPQMFYNVGVGGGGGGGNAVRGRTKRGKAAALAGGAVGVLGGLAGESRSLGGLLSNVQVGAMQGSAVGRGLANMGTSRRRQARADLEEQEKVDRAKEGAQRDLQQRRAMNPERLAAEGPSLASLMNPRNINRRRFEAEQGRLQQANQTNLNTQQLGQELAQLGTNVGQARLARDKREAKDRKMKLRDYQKLKPALDLAGNINSQQLTEAQNYLQNVQPVQTNPMGAAPVQQLPPPPGSVASGEGTDADVNRTLANEGTMDHQMNTESIQSKLESQDDEGGEQQGQQGQKPPEEFERRQGAFEGMGQFMQEGQQ